MVKREGLFVLTHVLGNATQTRSIKQALRGIDWVSASFLEFHVSDYRRYPSRGPLALLGSSFESAGSIREKFRAHRESLSGFEFVFLNSPSFALGLKELTSATPCILSLDTTDRLAHSLRAQESGNVKSEFERVIKNGLTSPRYREAFRHIDLFLPWSDWCAQSLVDDYRVEPARVIVGSCGIDTSVWVPPSRLRDRPEHLLFVGNDFSRKGGDIFLALLGRLAASGFRGTVVSNDPVLDEFDIPSNVRVIRGLTHNRGVESLVAVFQDADLLLFPSRNDKFGLVLLEAAATGMPAVARDVGGASTIVRDGDTGILMPYHADLDQWETALRSLGAERGRYAQMCLRAREMAERDFSEEAFERTLAGAIERVVINDKSQ